jgi:hypothetical protein
MLDALRSVGFHSCIKHRSNFFLVSEDADLSPAFMCRLVKRGGYVRYGGTFGIYFREFERTWRSSLSPLDKRLDHTLPLAMLIDNYMGLIDDGVFEYIDVAAYARPKSASIFRLCSRLPRSWPEFVNAVNENSLLGRPVSLYLHIAPYRGKDDLYAQKSIAFIKWLSNSCAAAAEPLFRRLSADERELLTHI